MRWRLDLFGRLLLIVLGTVLLLASASIALLRVRDEIKPPPPLSFPRLKQTAGIIDLVATNTGGSEKAIVRAVSGVDLTARLVDVAPPRGDLQRAPRLEAELQRLILTRTPVTAYVSPRFVPRDSDGQVEGFLARAVAQLSDGRILVIAAHGSRNRVKREQLNGSAALWMGAMAALVAALALWGTARETRPLRDLACAARRFDGNAVTVLRVPLAASDIRRTAAAVAAMQERVLALLGERSLMIATISHDLRTLLTRMRLRVASVDDQDRRDWLEADLDGMDAMLADALAFARGTTSDVHTNVDLADLAAAEIAERQVRDTRVEIVAELSDAPCIGDAHALRRVISNLLDNAAKYGGGRIRVSVTRRVDRVVLSVEDDGAGIPPGERQAVLMPYHRGEDPRSRRLAGSGLGLAIVQQIARAHGGALSIETSALGGAKMLVDIACKEGGKMPAGS